MGLLIGGAVFPAAFAITWAGQSTAGAISGCLVGLIAGLTAWLVTAYQYFGEITIASTGEEYSTLAGNLAAILTGLIVTVVVSLIKPQNFDWAITRAINARPVEGVVTQHSQPAQESTADGKLETEFPTAIDNEEKEKSDAGTATPPDGEYASEDEEDLERAADRATEENPDSLKRAFFVACIAAFVLTLIMDFLGSSQSLLYCPVTYRLTIPGVQVPIPMFLSHYIFSKGGFTTWVVISFLWVFASTGISVILPIVETIPFFKQFIRDVRAGGKAGRKH